MTYEAVRAFAGSWMLLFMFAFFVGVILWVLRPGSKQTYRDTANIVFRHEDAPSPAAGLAAGTAVGSGSGQGESPKEART